jgi:mitochondrial Rho GTPase 1
MPVILAGNKMDILHQQDLNDEEALIRSRQQFISLGQRFRFVRERIKCSARNLMGVTKIFDKARQAVLYPQTPICDMATCQLTPSCLNALTRIFRMYDKDRDGKLSVDELATFQMQTFDVPIFESDLSRWKKVLTKQNPNEPVLKDGKFSLANFFAVFDLFVDKNRLDFPWVVLRKYGYDDELNLKIPTFVTDIDKVKDWRLTNAAQTFLKEMFHQFDVDKDGILSADDIINIYSIFSDPALPAWHPERISMFDDCYAVPKISLRRGHDTPPSLRSDSEPMTLSQSFSASGITISSLPTLSMAGTVHLHPMSLLDWMGHWHMVSVIAPAETRTELYRLGHIEKSRRKSSKRKSEKETSSSEVIVTLRVCVIGSEGCGKSAFLNVLCDMPECESTFEKAPMETVPTNRPESSSAHVRIKSDEEKELVVHLVFTEIPTGDERAKELGTLIGPSIKPKSRPFDLVLFVFDCNVPSSLLYSSQMEKDLLTDDVPRAYVGTKNDGNDRSVTIATAEAHCMELDLEAPLLTSALENWLGAETETGAKQRVHVLSTLARCALPEIGVKSLKSKPHEEKRRLEMEEAKRQKRMWVGGLLGLSTVLAVGYGVFMMRKGATANRKSEASWGLGWVHSAFTGHFAWKADSSTMIQASLA